MDRRKIFTKGLSKSQRGLEIGPWHSPICPKREGWNVAVCDVFDTEQLLGRAKADPSVKADLIEDVDIVATGCEIGEIEERFDFVISSHNFEHLPDPIRFLQGVRRILKRGGTLVMALPDYRQTFDCFRPLSTIGEWLEAYDEGREQPSERQVFDALAYHAQADDPRMYHGNAELHSDLTELWQNWSAADYRDVHCSVLSPASFKLLLREAQALGLVELALEEVKSLGGEFLVRLRNLPVPDFDLSAERNRLIQEITRERQLGNPHSLPRRIATQIRYRLTI